MKSLTEHLWFEIKSRRRFINTTPTVEELVSQSGMKEGLCLVNVMHITEKSLHQRTTRRRSELGVSAYYRHFSFDASFPFGKTTTGSP